MRIPLVVQIKRHSLEDGPGIRSVVFFKGCPLRCRFCQNPETQSCEAQIAFEPARCVRCRACVDACPRAALTEAGGRVRFDPSRCERCEICVQVCPSGALRRIGRPYAIEALGEVLLRDRSYYLHSGGGVTFSGGEATLFPTYVGELARRLKSAGTHLCLQTCGYFPYDDIARTLLPSIDLILFDVKLADPKRHAEITGVDNALVWENLARLSRFPGLRVHPRIPVIAGMTADEENLTSLRERVLALGLPMPILLPENPFRPRVPARVG
jgi:pyruvate formate lyase activating enzyme